MNCALRLSSHPPHLKLTAGESRTYQSLRRRWQRYKGTGEIAINSQLPPRFFPQRLSKRLLSFLWLAAICLQKRLGADSGTDVEVGALHEKHARLRRHGRHSNFLIVRTSAAFFLVDFSAHRERLESSRVRPLQTKLWTNGFSSWAAPCAAQEAAARCLPVEPSSTGDGCWDASQGGKGQRQVGREGRGGGACQIS